MKKILIIIIAVLTLIPAAACTADNKKNDDILPETTSLPSEINLMTATVESIEGSRVIADDIEFYLDEFNIPGLKTGDRVEIKYQGGIMESYPGRFEKIISVEKLPADRNEKFKGTWLDKETAVKDENFLCDLAVTEIYSDCFFATALIPMPQIFKINYADDGRLCVGDKIKAEYEKTWYDKENFRVEAEIKGYTESTFEPEPGVAYKPVIYLYPEHKTDVSLRLKLKGRLTVSEPRYKNGWKITALPDGTLITKDGKSYPYLFWEGELPGDWDFSEGFCIEGSETGEFLRKTLPLYGMNKKETEDFISFWEPAMKKNPYNIISFQDEIYKDRAELLSAPAPDTVIRVFMAYKPSESFIKIQPPEIITPVRQGFTLTEWGGTKAG